MNNAKEKINKPHSLILNNRKELHLTGVANVDSFNDEIIVAYTDYGELVIRGKGMKMDALNVDTGELSIHGDIASAAYAEGADGKSLFAKIFR